MNIPRPEFTVLLNEVEKKYGHRVSTTKDFESLAAVVKNVTGDYISSSTLKRLWGYVTWNPRPRHATLDILSRYTGRHDFEAFCEEFKLKYDSESGYFKTQFIAASDLEVGDNVTIGWAPDRVVVMSYLGDFTFKVEKCCNSKLEIGDIFEHSDFMLGYPVHISRILRNGEYTPSYTAGREDGINLLKKGEI